MAPLKWLLSVQYSSCGGCKTSMIIMLTNLRLQQHLSTACELQTGLVDFPLVMISDLDDHESFHALK